jgi:hypothetical protein
MISKIKAFGAFAYDFVIGDDWWVAAGVAAVLAVTYGLSHGAHVASWWLIPVALLVLLPLTLWRALRK